MKTVELQKIKSPSPKINQAFSWNTRALTSILCLGTTSFPTYASSTTPECGVLAPPSLSFVQHCSINASSLTMLER